MKPWITIKDEVTFNAFARLMKVRHYNVDDLVDLFHGKLDDNRAFFTRAMKPDFEHLKVVIPYKSVLKFYFEELKSETLKKEASA